MTVINQEVTVNAFYFAGANMKTFPRSIEHMGRAITFMNGLRYLVSQGTGAVRLFDMSTPEGETYRLRQDGDQWMLVGTKGGF